MNYIKVHLINLPYSIRGFTIRADFNGFVIFINAKLNNQMQLKAYEHEIGHINANDYDHIYSVGDLETISHGI